MTDIRQLKLQPLSKNSDRIVRDWLYDQVSANGTEIFIERQVRLIRAWKREKREYLKRFKWCLSTLHTDQELAELTLLLLDFFDITKFDSHIASIMGKSVEEREASLCDMLLFGELNLSWGEAMGVGHFDNAGERNAFADGLGHDRHVSYGGDGNYYVVYDADLSD